MSTPPVYLTNFMDNHISDLIKIYIQERGRVGIGALFLEGEPEKSNVNVFYAEKTICNESIQGAMNSMDCSSKAHFILVEIEKPEAQFIMVHELDPKQSMPIIQEINDKEGTPELVD
jgi:hypothetical protein